MSFTPRKQKEFSDFIRFEDDQGLVYEVHGNNPRIELAYEIANSLDVVIKKSVDLLCDFIKFEGDFESSFVMIFHNKDEDGGDFKVRFTFEDNSNEFDNTYFDVFLNYRQTPSDNFWPIKFTIGFY